VGPLLKFYFTHYPQWNAGQHSQLQHWHARGDPGHRWKAKYDPSTRLNSWEGEAPCGNLTHIGAQFNRNSCVSKPGSSPLKVIQVYYWLVVDWCWVDDWCWTHQLWVKGSACSCAIALEFASASVFTGRLSSSTACCKQIDEQETLLCRQAPQVDWMAAWCPPTTCFSLSCLK